jgi:hypothetical protein
MKLKEILDLLNADTIYFENKEQNYIADTSDKMCHLKALPDDTVLKVSPFGENDLLVTLQK